MAEQTTTSNRPPLFTVAHGATLNGAKVELLGTPDDKSLDALKPSDQVWVREFLHYRAPGAATPLREAHVFWRNLERAFRTPQETELGRDFTGDEAAEYERTLHLRVARQMAEHRVQSINDRLVQMADRLQRASEDVRRLTEQPFALDQKVYQAQHELAWLVPNLSAESLTTDLVGWLQLDAEIKHLGGGASDEAAS